jgi:DNA-binding HxlR family transcriptional regulator
VATKSASKPRSECPVSASLDVLGDRWSLLIIRDMMVRGYRTFREFQRAGEGIATNILSDRLHRLEGAGVLIAEPVEGDGRSAHYRLTPKGIALAPVLLEPRPNPTSRIWNRTAKPSWRRLIAVGSSATPRL